MKDREYFFDKGEKYFFNVFQGQVVDNKNKNLILAIKNYTKFIHFTKKELKQFVDKNIAIDKLKLEIEYTTGKINYIKKFMDSEIDSENLVSIYPIEMAKLDTIADGVEKNVFPSGGYDESDELNELDEFDGENSVEDGVIDMNEETPDDELKSEATEKETLDAREKALNARESELDAREGELNARESRLDAQESEATKIEEEVDNSEKVADDELVDSKDDDFSNLLDVSKLIEIFSYKKIINIDKINRLYELLNEKRFTTTDIENLLINKKKIVKLDVVQSYKIIMSLREYVRNRGNEINSSELIALISSITPVNIYSPNNKKENYRLAEDYVYEDEYKFDINDPYYYFYKGNSEFVKGNYRDAIKHYILSLRVNINLPEVYFNLGSSYLSLGETGLAIENFTNANMMECKYDYMYYYKKLKDTKIFLEIESKNR